MNVSTLSEHLWTSDSRRSLRSLTEFVADAPNVDARRTKRRHRRSLRSLTEFVADGIDSALAGFLKLEFVADAPNIAG